VKEVRHYVEALQVGFEEVRKNGSILLKTLLDVQTRIEPKKAGLRKLPGTVLKNPASGRIVYEPPQSAAEVESLMNNLIDFLHAEDDLNPILRMAIAHHQFESIHPFYDGNGRTGRILNLLILQKESLLDLPVLYLSRYITTTKGEYYKLLQETHAKGLWKDWCLYMIRGVSMTARSEIMLVKSLRALMQGSAQQSLPPSLHEDRVRGEGARHIARHRFEISEAVGRRGNPPQGKEGENQLLHQ